MSHNSDAKLPYNLIQLTTRLWSLSIFIHFYECEHEWQVVKVTEIGADKILCHDCS